LYARHCVNLRTRIASRQWTSDDETRRQAVIVPASDADRGGKNMLD